jgi:hypothetical protein
MWFLYTRGFVCFRGRSAASHGCTAAYWLIVPPALDFPTLATRSPRAYRRVPHSSGGRWNLWTRGWEPGILPQHAFRKKACGRRAEDFSAPKNPTASAGFEPANLGTRGQHALDHRSRLHEGFTDHWHKQCCERKHIIMYVIFAFFAKF